MSRRRAQQTTGVQLFPFLDVLLSAMGALILLLALASRNLSKQEADLAANSPAADELRLRHEMVDWEIEQLGKQRDKTAADLAEERQQFGHLEQHARQLRSELEEILRAEEQLVAQSDNSDRENKEAEIRELRSRIAAAKNELESALADQEASGSSYAIVPYQGPNETRRRPIYIECRASEIVIQPEGVVLTAQDFDGPLGPGNPLAAAVRAAREHLSRKRSSSDGDSGEPYPLMLVRPDGIETFYAARAALDSWGSEFGYEFIEADWKIKYLPADSGLATVEQDAVDTAREQMRLVAQFAPRINRNVTARTYRASKSGGGIVAEDGGGPPSRHGFGHEGGPGHSGGFSADRGPRGGSAGDLADSGERGGSGYGGGSYRGGSASGRYGSSFDNEGGGYGGGYGGELGNNSAAGARATAPYRSALQDVQSRRSQAAAGALGGPLAGGAAAANAGRYGSGASGEAGSAAGASGGDGLGGGNGQAAEQIPPGTTNGQLAGGGAMSGNMSGNAAKAGNGAAGTSGQPGSSSPSEGPEFPSSGSGSPGAASNGGAAGGQQPPGIVGIGGGGSPTSPPPGGMNGGVGLPPMSAQFGEQGSQSQQSAAAQDAQQANRRSAPVNPFDSPGKAKGNYTSSKSGRSGTPSYSKRSNHQKENWALPEAAPSSVPLARPIRVQCREDRITVFADRGGTATSRVIEFGPDTAQAVDEFVAAIRDHMETWGIAGEGFYWHPIVKLETVGNGSARATELKALMANSGLEFRDPPPTDSVRRAMSHTMR